MPFDHFGVIAGLYNRAADFIVPAPLLDSLALSTESLLLDAGGGTGRVADVLRNMVRKIVVADPSRRMLNHAAAKGLITTCAPAELLPFASNVFDQIIMVDALHHVFNQQQTVDELWRVLAPGGMVVILEPDIHKFRVKLIALGEKMLLMRSRFLPAEKIVQLFSNKNAQARISYHENIIWVSADKVKKM